MEAARGESGQPAQPAAGHVMGQEDGRQGGVRRLQGGQAGVYFRPQGEDAGACTSVMAFVADCVDFLVAVGVDLRRCSASRQLAFKKTKMWLLGQEIRLHFYKCCCLCLHC